MRTTKNRAGGGDDHDVLDEGQVIGPIVRHPQAPNEAPWFWAVTAEPSLTDRNCAVNCEQAVAQGGMAATNLFALASLTSSAAAPQGAHQRD